MSKKYILIIAIILLIGAGVVVLQKSGNQNPNNALFSEFKKRCRVVEQSPFQDDSLHIRFQFNNDTLVCDYRPQVQEGRTRELYVWRKGAFQNSTMAGFGEGIIAKVTVNPLSGLPTGTTIETNTEMIAGGTVAVRTVRPEACDVDNCPTARIAELTHGGNTLLLEEYISEANLFKSFEFLPSLE